MDGTQKDRPRAQALQGMYFRYNKMPVIFYALFHWWCFIFNIAGKAGRRKERCSNLSPRVSAKKSNWETTHSYFKQFS